MHASADGLKHDDDVASVVNPAGDGPFVLVCEHASNTIPEELGTLGLDDLALNSHIAWDPGALDVALMMSKRLDAPLIAQRYSRLVYDCNRAADEPSAVPETSEAYTIPGNVGLTRAQCRARAERYYEPFHDAVGAVLDRRRKAGKPTVFITLHSFTPVYHGQVRDVELGVLHDSDARFADAILDVAAANQDMLAIRNAPYGPQDGVTFTLKEHALPRGLLNVMLEIRNDLIDTKSKQETMALRLSYYALKALEAINTDQGEALHA